MKSLNEKNKKKLSSNKFHESSLKTSRKRVVQTCPVTNGRSLILPLSFDHLFHGNPPNVPCRQNFPSTKGTGKGFPLVSRLVLTCILSIGISIIGRQSQLCRAGLKPQSNCGQRWRRFKVEARYAPY